MLAMPQAKTALAETPGSRFYDDCANLIQEERFADYAARISGQVDLLLRKTTAAKGEERFSWLDSSNCSILCVFGARPELNACLPALADIECSLNILCHAVGRVPEAQQAAVATAVASALSKVGACAARAPMQAAAPSSSVQGVTPARRASARTATRRSLCTAFAPHGMAGGQERACTC